MTFLPCSFVLCVTFTHRFCHDFIFSVLTHISHRLYIKLNLAKCGNGGMCVQNGWCAVYVIFALCFNLLHGVDKWTMKWKRKHSTLCKCACCMCSATLLKHAPMYSYLRTESCSQCYAQCTHPRPCQKCHLMIAELSLSHTISISTCRNVSWADVSDCTALINL